MESTVSVSSNGRRSGSSYSRDDDYDRHTYKSYISGPIWFINSLEQVAEALRRCLGFRSPADHEANSPSTITTTNHHRHTPQSTNPTKEVEVGVKSMKIVAGGGGGGAPPKAAGVRHNNNNNRKPPRPPVSSGGGGKTN